MDAVLCAEEPTELIYCGGATALVFFDDARHKVGILIFYIGPPVQIIYIIHGMCTLSIEKSAQIVFGHFVHF